MLPREHLEKWGRRAKSVCRGLESVGKICVRTPRKGPGELLIGVKGFKPRAERACTSMGVSLLGHGH